MRLCVDVDYVEVILTGWSCRWWKLMLSSRGTLSRNPMRHVCAQDRGGSDPGQQSWRAVVLRMPGLPQDCPFGRCGFPRQQGQFVLLESVWQLRSALLGCERCRELSGSSWVLRLPRKCLGKAVNVMFLLQSFCFCNVFFPSRYKKKKKAYSEN